MAERQQSEASRQEIADSRQGRTGQIIYKVGTTILSDGRIVL